MNKGDLIRVRLCGGEVVVRRFVTHKKHLIVVCNEDEFRQSQKEGREPEGIGFPKEDILGIA
jgi:hypothetical protein